MLVPEGLCHDLNENLFRSTSSESRRHLPNRHGNEKEAINRIPPRFDWPKKLTPSISGETQFIGLGVEPVHALDYESKSHILFASSPCGAPRASIILPSEQLSRPERRDVAGSPLSVSEIGRTVWSKRISRPHSLRAMGGTETLDDSAVQSTIMAMPHETFSAILESRRTEVMIAEPSGDLSRNGNPASSSTTPRNLNRDASPSSPPFISTIPSTKETAYPSVITTPITTEVVARTNTSELLDMALFITPHLPLVIAPQEPRSFNVRRKPPPPMSNLVESLPASIIAGQSSSGTCGGSTSHQFLASSSLACKGASMPSSPSPSMDRDVKPIVGQETYPLSSSSVTSTSSGSSHVTMIGPTPQSSYPDLPSPPLKRTSRLSIKRLLPNLASSSPHNSRKLVKRPSRVPEGPLVDPRANISVGSLDLTTPATGRTTFVDPIVASGSRIDSGHPVCPGASILSAFSKVLRSNDVVLSKEQRPLILASDIQLSGVDVQMSPLDSTSSHNHSNAWDRRDVGRGEKEKAFKGEGTDGAPARRRGNVLRKRSHPCMIGASHSTTPLGSSPSPLDRNGHQNVTNLPREHEEPIPHNIRQHDIDRIPISQPQSVAVPRTPELEIPHGSSSEESRKKQQGATSNSQRLSPTSLIATQRKAKMTEGSDEISVLCDPLREGKREGSIKDRVLLRSSSMSDILFSNTGSLNCQMQNTEEIFHAREKTRDRARQSLNLSIAGHPNGLDKEKVRKSAPMVPSKAGGGRLRRLMRKFSISGSGGARGERPPPLPAWAFSTPMAFPSVITELNHDHNPSLVEAKARGRTPLRSSRLAISNPEITSATTNSSPDRPVSVPLDLHIMNPSVLDQTCGAEDRFQPSIQNTPPMPSCPRMPPEGEWMRSHSPDLELAALPPPRRAPKIATGPPSQPGVEADGANGTRCSSPFIPVFSIDDTINTFPVRRETTSATISPSSDSLNICQSRSVADTPIATYSAVSLSDVPNLSSCGTFIPSISVIPPSQRPLTNPQRSNCERLFIEDTQSDPLHRITTIDRLMPSTTHKAAEETDQNSNAYLTFTSSPLNTTPSVVFRPGTANTFGGSENIRPGTSDSIQSAISTPTERFKSHSPLVGYSSRRTT